MNGIPRVQIWRFLYTALQARSQQTEIEARPDFLMLGEPNYMGLSVTLDAATQLIDWLIRTCIADRQNPRSDAIVLNTV